MRHEPTRCPVPIARMLAVLAILLLLGIAGRLLPHPPNFTPVAAAALFAGFFFTRRPMAMLVPLGILAVSDLFLGTYQWPVMLTVYGAFLFPLVFAPRLKARLTALRVGGFALCGAVFFFLSTNLAVWLFAAWYPKTPAGLLQCYVAALPFLKYKLLGDLLWSGAIFGSYAVVRQLQSSNLTRVEALVALGSKATAIGARSPEKAGFA